MPMMSYEENVYALRTDFIQCSPFDFLHEKWKSSRLRGLTLTHQRELKTMAIPINFWEFPGNGSFVTLLFVLLTAAEKRIYVKKNCPVYCWYNFSGWNVNEAEEASIFLVFFTVTVFFRVHELTHVNNQC